MSRIIICDCCGDKIPLYEEKRSLKMETSHECDDIIKEDICKNCYDKIVDFMFMMKEKK